MLRCDHKVAIRSHDFIDTLAPERYDQFGCIPAAQGTDDYTLVTKVQLQHGVHSADFLGFLAARDLVQTTFTWDPDADALMVTPMLYTWLVRCGLIPFPLTYMLHFLGRQTKIIQNSNGVILRFLPAHAHGVLPPWPFQVTLAVLAFRTMMTSALKHYPDMPRKMTLLKWLTRPLWNAELPTTMPASLVLRIMQLACQPVNGITEHRLISSGKQIMPETLLQNLSKAASKDSLVIHAVMQLKGGGEAKHQHKMLQQTARPKDAALAYTHQLLATFSETEQVHLSNIGQKMPMECAPIVANQTPNTTVSMNARFRRRQECNSKPA